MLDRRVALVFVMTVGLIAILVTSAFGQRTFSYKATDYQTIVASDSQNLSISVQTIIVVLGDPNAATPVSEPTHSFIVHLRPPQVEQSHIVQAHIQSQPVHMALVSSNFDGELEARVDVPVSLGDHPTVQVDWSTKDKSCIETTAECLPIPVEVHPRIVTAPRAHPVNHR